MAKPLITRLFFLPTQTEEPLLYNKPVEPMFLGQNPLTSSSEDKLLKPELPNPLYSSSCHGWLCPLMDMSVLLLPAAKILSCCLHFVVSQKENLEIRGIRIHG